MKANNSRIAWTLLLCLGLVLAPTAAMAQQGKAPSADKVNLNTASAEQLESLPGVGPSLAKRIIEHRTKVGKFTRIEELLNVKGIGEKSFQKLKDRLTV
jgi:comEA protein